MWKQFPWGQYPWNDLYHTSGSWCKETAEKSLTHLLSIQYLSSFVGWLVISPTVQEMCPGWKESQQQFCAPPARLLQLRSSEMVLQGAHGMNGSLRTWLSVLACVSIVGSGKNVNKLCIDFENLKCCQMPDFPRVTIRVEFVIFWELKVYPIFLSTCPTSVSYSDQWRRMNIPFWCLSGFPGRRTLKQKYLFGSQS